MGWLWGSSEAKATSSDPYSKLDPALREFLDKESPLKYNETQPTATKTQPAADEPQSYRAKLGWDQPSLDQESQTSKPQPEQLAVPQESLYQDGRYAHLWKNYRPQSEIESSGRSDQDRLADVVAAYNDRKAAIGRAAVENCALEQMAERDCWENGSLAEKFNMCRGPNREFLRCYTMQSRFLKALGYLNTMRSPEEEEKIQMHADKLYHQMLDREREAEEAKKEGKEAPSLTPLITAESTEKALGSDSAFSTARARARELGMTNTLSQYAPEKQEQIKESLKGMNERERELELQLIAAETRAELEYADKIKAELAVERQARAERRDRGKETIGDTIKRLWGWDK
ncbi:Hypothetical protein R9X50_00005100 [Acrodontium crateriforme]|uniref:Autophagy protein n=1 Tax=Acrodontium crateriforme TaxID=150365 RepID=A0AAQ3LZN5_9PEZI|nr:Hypothetical protein R9X50_00005100 [Acrodontium crateriforme]